MAFLPSSRCSSRTCASSARYSDAGTTSSPAAAAVRYRRLHILLRRDGITINRKKTQRLCREEGLTVRRRKGRRLAVGAPAPVLALPNQHRSLDFVHIQLATGRRFRILSIVDDVKDSSATGPLLHISRERGDGKINLIIIDTPANSKDIAMLAVVNHQPRSSFN
jgi:transposase InsO family protein